MLYVSSVTENPYNRCQFSRRSMINSTGWLGIHRTKVKQTKKITLTSLSVFIEVRLSYYRIYRDQSRKDFVQKQYFLQLF